MPYGYTECPICHETVTCRGLKKHIDNTHPTQAHTISNKNNFINDNNRFLLRDEKIKSRSTKIKEASVDAYKIADRFIVNSITDGTISLNLKRLVEDGRAKIAKNGDSIIITVQLAKFRKAFNW